MLPTRSRRASPSLTLDVSTSRVLWLPLCAAALLYGCGGGGGGNGSSSTSTPTSAISGSVVDGFIAGATITAYQINPDGTLGSQLGGPVTSDSNGGYSLNVPVNLNSNTNPILIKSQGGNYADWASGNTIQLSSSDSLYAVIPNATGSITSQVTPLTNMAAKYAIALLQASQFKQSLTDTNADVSSAITYANDKIGQYFSNIDILNTPVFDPTSGAAPADAGQGSIDYSLMIAGISQYASANNLNPFSLVSALGDDVSDGVFNGMNGSTPLSVSNTTGGASSPLSASAGTQDLGSSISIFQASPDNLSTASISAGFLSALQSSGYNLAPTPGTLDLSYGSHGISSQGLGFNVYLSDAVLQTGSKLVTTGRTGSDSLILLRQNTDGSIDTSFGPSNTGYNVSSLGSSQLLPHAIVQQSDGKLLIAGEYATPYVGGGILLARYDSDGNPDTAFGSSNTGMVTTPFNNANNYDVSNGANAIALQTDGKIVVAGGNGSDAASFGGGVPEHYYFALARYNTDGSLDSTFGTAGKVLTPINAPSVIPSHTNGGAVGVLVQQDGKILVTGDSNGAFVFVRYLSDGSLDASFGTSGIIVSNPTSDYLGCWDMTTQADGKILLVGNVLTDGADTSTVGVLVRYNPDATLDTAFGSSGVVRIDLSSGAGELTVKVQNDQKIVVATSQALLRFNSDGSPDTSFGLSGDGQSTIIGSNIGISSIVFQDDGKILLSGATISGGSDSNFVTERYLP